jgi:hypothetical protein
MSRDNFFGPGDSDGYPEISQNRVPVPLVRTESSVRALP